MNKEDLVNLWDEYREVKKTQITEPNFPNFMQWLKDNDTRTEANPYIYDQPDQLYVSLRKILADVVDGEYESDDQAIADIKALFSTPDHHNKCVQCESEKRVVQGLSSHVVGRRQACLTGQEWYKRFKIQTRRYVRSSIHAGDGSPLWSENTMLEAARKATGLDENGEVV